MKKIKVALSWFLTLLMILSLFTGFQIAASAAALDDLGIFMDDDTVTAVAAGDNVYTVKIPDGRPRIPQITCDGATSVTQAFMTDEATQASAKVVLSGTTYTITFVKDASLGFVLQYDDHYTWDSGITGATYTSSNSAVASVDGTTGEIVVNAVSANPVTITATNGSDSKTLTITKTIRAVLGLWMLTGQSNAAYNYNDATTAVAPAEGTAYYAGKYTSSVTTDIKSMTTDAGKATVGGLEPAMAKSIYEKTGEKVLMMNAAISGTGIAKFLPGCSTDTSSYTWALINYVYEEVSEKWEKAAFQANYEVRNRSYFFLQGCAEVGSYWEIHYNGFAVNRNTNAFTTKGVSYPAGSHTFHTYMTEVLGFDACMDIMVSWRPVGITTSTRTAQFKLAEDLDNYYIATRINQTMSEEEGTYRGDRLHMNQAGKNETGVHAGSAAARIYTGELREAATGAYAYFNKNRYVDGSTLYVQAGDFYNYCTRPINLSSDDRFSYKFLGDDVIDYDGENDFIVDVNAAPGSSCKMEIYSETNAATPLTTINIQVIGERTDEYNTFDTATYEWTFDENKQPTTVAGDIDLVPAEDSGFEGKSTLQLTRDLTLNSDGYWSIEWKGTAKDMDMLMSSANGYSGSSCPNFVYTYFRSSTGWVFFRDTAYTDYFWRACTQSDINQVKTFKLECRNNVYTFSIDGVIYDSRAIEEGHGSYRSNSSISVASSSAKGYFDNQFNVHYILGGLNKNGLSSTKYSYAGDIEYVKIMMGEEDPAITKVNNYPYVAESGSGTVQDPYVINANVEADTVIDASVFTISSPKGTVAMSAEKFGGATLDTLTIDAGTKSVYVMILGSIPSMSTFYKVNFTVSDNPDVMYYEVMVDNSSKAVVPDGTKVTYTVGGTDKVFIKGKSLFTSIQDAIRLVSENDGIVYISAGEYDEDVEINRAVAIKGAQAGVNPNAAGAQNNVAWTNTRADLTKETVLTGSWTMTNTAGNWSLDGVTFSEKATFEDERNTADQAVQVDWKNIVITGITTDKAFKFGEATTSQTSQVVGTLNLENVRAHTNGKAALFNLALDNINIKNSYFDGTSCVDAYRVPGVVDGLTDHIASYNVEGCMFDGADRANIFRFNIYPTTSNTNVDSYETVALSFKDNIWLNTIYSGGSSSNGSIYVYSNGDNLSFNFEGNWVYTDENSYADDTTAFIYGAGYTAGSCDEDYKEAYNIKGNRFIAAEDKHPMIFSSETTNKGHSNVNVGGNYSEINGVVSEPVSNVKNNSNTGYKVSFFKYYYKDSALTESTCNHTSTTPEYKAPSCAEEGYDRELCNECEELIRNEILAKSDHVKSDWKVDTEPTCAAEGKEVIKCTVCLSVLEERAIAATGHDDGKWKIDVDPSCSAEGTRVKLCTVCHTELDSEPIAKLDHNYVSINKVDSTCTATGIETFECTSCHDIKEEVVAKKLHTPGEWTVIVPATCEQIGTKEITCTDCGKQMDVGTIPLTHNFEWVEQEIEIGVIFVKIKTYECTNCELVTDIKVVDDGLIKVEKKFEDVGSKDWFVKNGSVAVVVGLGIFNGTSKTTFSPNAPMTRAMFVTVLGRLSGVEVDDNTKTRFNDVATGEWYSGYVAWAVENHIVDGTSYYTFDPNVSITREQACKILVAYCDYEETIGLNKVEDEIDFKDSAKISSWAKNYVKTCQMAGVINGTPDGKFNPKNSITRAEVATVILNLIENQMQ